MPHDAREPIQFVFDDGSRKLGVLTDAGMSTAYLIEHLRGMDALVLECNHDRGMLANSSYPPSLKARIGVDFGHLTNEIAAEILASVKHSSLKTVVAAHLSLRNNTEELATLALAGALSAARQDIHVAKQHEGLGWRDV